MNTYLKTVLVAGVLAALSAPAGAAIWTDDFESGYTLGAELRTHPDWFYEAAHSGPTVQATNGVNGSRGLTEGQYIFTWEAHPFTWSDSSVTGVVAQMDLQTDGSGHFDDDRLGWMISVTDDSSDHVFGIQLDPGGSGYNIEGYWDHNDSDTRDRRPSIVDLPSLSNNAWYRFRAEIMKLTGTSASIHVELWSLDGAGNPVTKVVQGDIADTSAILPSDDRPDSRYFTAGQMWPAYKNYTGTSGNADNVYFDVVPEPATICLLAFGGVALIRRKRK